MDGEINRSHKFSYKHINKYESLSVVKKKIMTI